MCQPGHDHACEAITAVHQSIKYQQRVNKSCGKDEFTDESKFYHTMQYISENSRKPCVPI